MFSLIMVCRNICTKIHDHINMLKIIKLYYFHKIYLLPNQRMVNNILEYSMPININKVDLVFLYNIRIIVLI